ncbi:hypothetical protein CF68_08550 [Cupriavidus sp. SK-4]|uniref:hypothetical protein n=1 Tax=Cupriavidus sp. SK-4 TaxID=574750 RepID=UPI0004509EAF|nr:hypothetical protein [Cupriavidus sp. SK-4]EYS85875.1 hypothetical protein CF68_08550 [Cupriavidus sp. SK-4]
MTSFKRSHHHESTGHRSARGAGTRRPRLLWLRGGTHRRALLHALIPTLLMMIGASISLSAKAAPRSVDPYTDGAASAATAKGRFDVYSDGARVRDPRDTYTDGARSEPRPADANG